MEEEYGFFSCFEIWSSLGVSTYDGNSFQDGDCRFMTQIWFWAFVRLEGERCDFCEKKKVEKKKGIY